MAQLPLVNSDDQTLVLIQTKWKSLLDPILSKTIINGSQLSNIAINGSNAIAHKLGRQPQGWFLTDINAAVSVYRTAWDANYLTLFSNGSATISLWVY